MMEVDPLSGLDEDIRRFEAGGLTPLRFTSTLESRYQKETSRVRAGMLLTQGLVALLAYDSFIVGDYLLAPANIVRAAIIRFGVVTPLVALVALVVRRRTTAFTVELSASFLCVLSSISILYLNTGGTASFSAFAQTGLILVLLVSNCMLRIEQTYALATTAIILLMDAVALGMDPQLHMSQKMFHGGLLVWVAILTLSANYALNRERRYSYLLQLRGRLQHHMLATANAELLAISETDRLTGLPNRRSYDERLSEMWQISVERNELLSAVMIDVDHFKRLNDAHGHPYGDRVLQRVATLLQQALRGEDDFVARFGGEEFIVLLPNAGSATALKVAERIRVLVQVAGSPALMRESAAPSPSSADVWSTVSCGVATVRPVASRDPSHLIAEADAAMYRAKQEGRNRVCCGPLPPGSPGGIAIARRA